MGGLTSTKCFCVWLPYLKNKTAASWKRQHIRLFCECICVREIIPLLYVWLCLFSPFRLLQFFLFLFSRFFFLFLFLLFFACVGHKPFPYCFNKHLKCLAADLRCVYKMSARPFAAVRLGWGGARMLVVSRWKVWQNPFKPLKNSSTYFAFFIRLMKVFRLFGSVSRAAQQQKLFLTSTDATPQVPPSPRPEVSQYYRQEASLAAWQFHFPF